MPFFNFYGIVLWRVAWVKLAVGCSDSSNMNNDKKIYLKYSLYVYDSTVGWSRWDACRVGVKKPDDRTFTAAKQPQERH